MNKYFFIKSERYRRKNRRAKNKAKELNIMRANLKIQNKNQGTQVRYGIDSLKNGRKIRKVEIGVGTTLSVSHNLENVIRIIKLLEKNSLYGVAKTHIKLDLSLVDLVDIGALSLLLAKVNEITKSRKVLVSGNFPVDLGARGYIAKSGFLDHMFSLGGNKFPRNNDNFLVRIGGKETDNESVGLLIKKCMKIITGSESHYPPVFSIIQEMTGNSVEHANIHNKNWLLGVNFTYDTDNNCKEILFTMVDVGFGILHTINRKWYTYIIEELKLVNKAAILSRAFDRKYGSSTNEPNRNRGLPLIKQVWTKGQIKFLKVITNDVILDFENIKNSTELKKNLPGTFYCWKVDIDCIKLWKTPK